MTANPENRDDVVAWAEYTLNNHAIDTWRQLVIAMLAEIKRLQERG